MRWSYALSACSFWAFVNGHADPQKSDPRVVTLEVGRVAEKFSGEEVAG